MPQSNRDQESLYPPGRLSLWFLASSAVLVVVLLAMVATDFIRPWKSTQRDYFTRLAGVLDLRREREEARVKADESIRKQLDELAAKLVTAERTLAEKANADKLALWTGEVAERDARMLTFDTQIKAIKGKYAERKYQYEIALHEHRGDAASIAATINRLGSEQERLERLYRDAEVERKEFLGKIDALEAPVRKLREDREKLLARVAAERTAATGARDKVEADQWRNLPVLDIVARTIKVEKVVVKDVHEDLNFTTSPKVDMCMTCHRGIDQPAMTERSVAELLAWFLQSRLGEKAWTALEAAPAPTEAGAAARAWLKVTAETPARDLPADGGLRDWLSGSPTLLDLFPKDRLRTALGDAKGDGAAAPGDPSSVFRDRHLGGKSFEEGGADLLAPFAIRRVEWAHPHLESMVGANSPHKMEVFGCTSCHQGVGRRLDFVRASHNPGSEDERKRWKAEHDWKPAELVENPMLPSQYVEGQCLKCHSYTIPNRPMTEALKREGDVRERGKTVKGRLLAPEPVNGPIAKVTGKWHPDVADLGLRAIKEHGCTGCHVIDCFEPCTPVPDPKGPAAHGTDLSVPAKGSLTSVGVPKVGPDLTKLRWKASLDWVFRWIEAPTAYRIDTRMPAFYKHVKHHNYVPVPGPDGKPIEELVVLEPTEKDRVQLDVEVLALATYLRDGQPTTPEEKAKYDALYVAPPAGDPALGKKYFYSLNCYACHLGPDDRPGSDLPKATLERFAGRDELPPGPRLTSLGSKLNAGWLFAWLKEPRHYNSVTRMPNTRWKDELAADGKTVVRSADQMYADVVAYLLQAKDDAFDARPVPNLANGVRWSTEHRALLVDFWKEWYGKTITDANGVTTSLTVTRAEQIVNEQIDANVNAVLAQVGKAIVGMRGCFGCHNIKGFEDAQPIGKNLSHEGSQDIHQFDFGLLAHPYGHMEMDRWTWISNKLENPRIFDLGRVKPRWQDKLRMPKFNFRGDEREAVTGVVLGLVKDPLQPGARYRPDDGMEKILKGREVVRRYGCNQCHTIEGRQGVLHAEQAARGLEGWMLPPNLYGQGNRTKADWLFSFMKHPIDVRPGVIQRMPMFRLSDEEAVALVDYFFAVAGRKDRLASDPLDTPLDPTPYKEPVTLKTKGLDGVWKETVVTNEIEEAKALFETRNCVTCHLPKGTPGVDPSEGGSAPPFTLAAARLQHSWVLDMIHNPQWQIAGTKMPSNWAAKSRKTPGDSIKVDYPQFLVGARRLEKPTNDDIAEAQMLAISRYLLWHYKSAAPAPAGN
ncbi:MAG: c-type cytochrome [Planctomycetia bacterium]|nr:c-type cytochrome [Planctomycetia bacterium]